MTHSRLASFGITCACLAQFNSAVAQSRAPQEYGAALSRSEQKVEVALANVAIGALTGGAANLIRGERPWRGLAHGAAGGAVWFSGKLLATSDMPASGLLGRQVASVGSSIVANVVADQDPLGVIVLPLYLLRVDVELHNRGLRARVDVPATLTGIYAAAKKDMAVDWGRTVHAGALVILDQTKATTWAGRHAAGVIIIKDQNVPENWWLPVQMDRVLRHEQVHLIQHDLTNLIVGRPVQSWIAPLLPGIRTVSSYTDLRVDLAGWAASNKLLAYDQRPWEWEAKVLARAKSGRIVESSGR